ncbi:MAG: MarR family transcriptional regulator [Pseudomonadota bacterium]
MSPSSPSPADASRAVTGLLARLARLAESDGFSAGLNPAQWSALRYLHEANRFSRSASAFALYHGTTRGTASQTLKALVDKGLVNREIHREDRRRATLSLTPRGEELLSNDPYRRFVAAAECIPDQTRNHLLEGLQQLWALCDEATGTQFGACRRCRHLRPCDETSDAYQRCGKNDSPLLEGELDLLCVNFETN